MKRFMSGDPATQAVFTWSRALWTLLFAGLAFALYCLLSEEQTMLLIFLAVPIAAFFVSGKGQDMSDGSNKTDQGTNSRASTRKN